MSTMADALAKAGQCRQAGDLDGALACLEGSLPACPDANERPSLTASFYNDLGIAFGMQRKLSQAATCLERALRFRPDFVEAHNNLGNVRQDQGRPGDAETCFRTALRLRPYFVRAHYNLAKLLAEHGQHEEALASFNNVLRVEPDHVDAHLNLAGALMQLGKKAAANPATEAAARNHFAAAATHLQQVLDRQPHHEAARFFLAVLTGGQTPDAAPLDAVRHLFDSYAKQFDQNVLGMLDYRAPQLLRAALGDLAADRSLRVLDLGCGTGLCGPLFRDAAQTLIGVDLSPEMLAEARQRGVYDQLRHSDLTEFLASCEEQYDVVLAADVFVYFGSLAQVFAGAKRVLRPGGRFAFTVEAHEGASYVARASARFAHSLPYLRELAEQNGLAERNAQRATLRKESHTDLEGFVVVLQRLADQSDA
jgi:predicted TPR repeat methyltransferase